MQSLGDLGDDSSGEILGSGPLLEEVEVDNGADERAAEAFLACNDVGEGALDDGDES